MAESSSRRKIAVILATDVVGYSTKMEEDEDQTLKNLKVCRSIIDGLVEEYHGRNIFIMNCNTKSLQNDISLL